MKQYKVIIMSLLFSLTATQPVMVNAEAGVLSKSFSFLMKIPLAPGNMAAKRLSGVQLGGYEVGNALQGWLPKVILSFVTYYTFAEIISSLRAKYRKMKRDNPKRQIIQAAIDQLVFLKEAQKRLQEKTKEREESKKKEASLKAEAMKNKNEEVAEDTGE